MLTTLLIVSLSNSALLIIADKWGIRERLQVHSPSEVFYTLISCTFCLGFWMALFEIVVFCLLTCPGFEFYLIPLPAAVITKLTA